MSGIRTHDPSVWSGQISRLGLSDVYTHVLGEVALELGAYSER
jgi:hypothetical protein